jgi:diguanylate cyclase (GGDEF)-like protein
MTRGFPLVRLSLGFAGLTVSLIFIAAALGLWPDRQTAVLAGRKALCEEMAIHCSYSAQRGDLAVFEATMQAIVRRLPEVESAAVRKANGQLVVVIGDHEAHWTPAPDGTSTATQVFVPIIGDEGLWGTVELRFAAADGLLGGLISDPLYTAAGFIGVGGFVGYYLLLRRIFRSLGTGRSGLIPKRVRTALNTLVEGVIILDNDQRIALANDAFADLVGRPSTDLEGCEVAKLPWADGQADGQAGRVPTPFPWQRALSEGVTTLGTVLVLTGDNQRQHTLQVNAAPILADDGTARGAMATFANLTPLQKKNVHLRRLLDKLKQSRGEIGRQNEMRRRLATRDPLTECLNRRAFFEAFEAQWSATQRYGTTLACVMVDIDHFKSVNDKHGHATGDVVLQQVAARLNSMMRQSDLLCRYGGEEFCVLLPHIDLDGAASAAERFRAGIEAHPCGPIHVTASLGVSALGPGAHAPSELVNQADVALYQSKRTGRNRVTAFRPGMNAAPKASEARHAEPREVRGALVSIPFHAVTALVSALGYRHADTAEHSRRVADLCVAAANGLLSQRECYVLEVAGLLHDIGKLGVPDAVLLKPGPLNEAEWKVIRTHEAIGEAIITSAFSCDELTDMIRRHHCWYGGTPHDADLPCGEAIPLGARLLAIADAYDAMVSDRVYRKGRSRADAFAELGRCAGVQFDPVLVEHFISAVLARDESRTPPALAISKQTALKVGVQIEKLANALDAGDHQSLASMAAYLNATATMHDVGPIAAVAARLEQSANAPTDRIAMTELAIELIDLCRATYRVYLPQGDNGRTAESVGERAGCGTCA